MIDSHLHLWDPARGDYHWLVPGSPLHRAYRPADVAPLLARSRVTGVVLVQAAPTAAETDYLLQIAHATPLVRGVVGWIDLEAYDAVARIVERASDPLLVGVRPMLQDLPERQWILKPELAAPIEAIRDHGLVFDALVRADQLNTLDILAERYPRLSIVLDHAGKPPFGNATALLEWRAGVQRIAARENVSCKLSGLLTELPNGVPRDRVNWCVDLLMDLFAPSRLLWGSDWPVATAASDYDDWLRQCQQRATVRHPHDVAAFFETNAQRIYGLGLHAAH